MKLLVGYLALANLAGLLSMRIDKQQAKKGKYRISEHMLLAIAAAGGSIGSIAGMYLFRHKTKHKRFVIGLPVILFLQIVILLIAASVFHAQAGRPSAAVRRELEMATRLDDDTIRSFISYQVLSGQQIPEAEEEAALDAVRLFFRKFQYSILSEQISSNKADVTVSFSNIDTHALAHDLCLSLASSWQSSNPSSDQTIPFTGFFTTLRDVLASHSYDLVSTQTVFHLTLKDHKWIPDEEPSVSDALMGDLRSSLKDPYILTPDEVLSLIMEQFRTFDSEDWIRYLNANDLFATGSPAYAARVDKTFFKLVASCYDWELLSCDVSGSSASLRLQITSVNLKEILFSFHEKLMSYASTTQSITDDSTEFSDMTAKLMLEAMKEEVSTNTYIIDLSMHNDGNTWRIDDVSGLLNAILGDLEGALEIMR